MAASTPEGPLVICLARTVDGQSSRISELEALASTLGGRVEVHLVSARTAALHVTLPADVASRFVAAMALAGAAVMETSACAAARDLIVLVTHESKPSERIET